TISALGSSIWGSGSSGFAHVQISFGSAQLGALTMGSSDGSASATINAGGSLSVLTGLTMGGGAGSTRLNVAGAGALMNLAAPASILSHATFSLTGGATL